MNLDLCLEVDAIDLNQTNDDYDPYEVFMRINSRRIITGRDRTPLALLPSQSTLVNNDRHYNFADDDTPVKYPLAIGFIDRRLKQQNVKFIFLKLVLFIIFEKFRSFLVQIQNE